MAIVERVSDRTLRILESDITAAHHALCRARRDGNAAVIREAAKVLDEKLDRYSELSRAEQRAQ